MILAINYSDENFKKKQKYNTKTAYKKGKADRVIEYSPKDIDEKFYEKHKEILDEKRGGGYWLWKPYIILKALDEIKEGDYLFYCDSGAFYVKRIKNLVDSMERAGENIMLFELPLIEKQWTKRELFETIGCDFEKNGKENQIMATYFLIKKSLKSQRFFEKYLSYACKKNVLNDIYDAKIQCKEFLEHRHDQSLLSLLAKKENIKPFRDPSQYGMRPWEYRSDERIYKSKIYINSSYPRIVVSNRKVDPLKFKSKEMIKTCLYKMNILNEKWYLKKHSIE